jgi:hypothetical protein
MASRQMIEHTRNLEYRVRSCPVLPKVVRRDGLSQCLPKGALEQTFGINETNRSGTLRSSCGDVVVRSGKFGTACVIPPSIAEANCSDLVVVNQPGCVVSTYQCFYLNSLAASHIEAGSVGRCTRA